MHGNQPQKQAFNEAMDHLHASDDLYERVIRQTAGGKRKRSGTARPLAAVAAAILIGAAGLGGTAYAVVTSDFFQTAFGAHGTDGAIEWTNSESGYTYRQEFSTVDPAEVSPELAEAVEPVGYTLEGNGYTMTIKDMVIDENGCGAVRFSLDGPEGLGLYKPEENGNAIVFDPTGPKNLALISMEDRSGNFLDAYAYYDVSTKTETHLDATMYFTPIGDSFEQSRRDALTGVRWRMVWNGEDQQGDSRSCEAYSDYFTPRHIIGTRAYSDGHGASARLSPYSIHFNVSTGNGSRFNANDVALGLSDGSIATITSVNHDVDDTQVINTYVQAGFGDGSAVYSFSTFVNTSDVEAISIAGDYWTSEHETFEAASVELSPEA